MKSSIKKNNKENKSKNKTIITKETISYAILSIVDIILIIYAARKNYANFVSIAGSKNIYIGKNTRYLLLGKNYITLIITTFMYIYTFLLNKFILHKNITKKELILFPIILLLINCILFYIFTNKIY